MAKNTIGKRSQVVLTQQLRQAVLECGVTRYQISKETGVSERALSQFVNGQRGLSMNAMDAIGGFLRLVIVVKGKPGTSVEGKVKASPSKKER